MNWKQFKNWLDKNIVESEELTVKIRSEKQSNYGNLSTITLTNFCDSLEATLDNNTSYHFFPEFAGNREFGEIFDYQNCFFGKKTNQVNINKTDYDLLEKLFDDWKLTQINNKNINKNNTNMNTRNILLIGRTGGGKSTIANVLLNRNEQFDKVFRESSESVSETRDLQIELLEIKLDEEGKEKVNYRIVDTVGVGDTKIDPQGVLWKLARIAHELKDGLNQVLFVTKGRFTKEEAEAYDLLSSIIFDSEVVKYTTIVRTNFHNFLDEKKCEEDRSKLKEENPTIAHIFKSVRKIIYVDNPPMEGYYLEIAKQVREKSRKRLLTYLGTCQSTYCPSNLATLNERIGDYMTNEEKLQKEMERLEKIRKEQEEKFRKEMAELKVQQEKELRENREKFEKDIHNVKVESEENLRKTKRDLEDEQKRKLEEQEQKNKERERQAEEKYNQKIRNIEETQTQQKRDFQSQLQQSRSETESLRNKLSEVSSSSASEMSAALAQLSLSNKSSDDGDWKVRMKELESADLRAQQAHEARMLELKNQKKENDAKVVSSTQAYVEERKPGVTAGLAGAGATVGSAFGPLGTVVGGVGGFLLGKLLS